VYRLASGSLVGGNTLELAAIRLGGAFESGTLSIRNASAADSLSERLQAQLTSVSGNALVTGGTVLQLGAQETDATTLRAKLTTPASAGLASGTLELAYFSDGAGTTGGALVGVGSATVNVVGRVYRLAVGTLVSGAVNLGNIRQGGPFAFADLGVANIADASDGFSDDLGATISGSGPFVGLGTLRGLAAGQQSLSGGLRVGLSNSLHTGTAYGVLSGSLMVAYQSQGRALSGLGEATPAVAAETVQVTGAVYQPGTLALETGALPAVVDLGRVRLNSGQSFQSGTFRFGNGTSEGLYSESLEVASTTMGALALAGGSSFLLTPGSWGMQAVRYVGSLENISPGLVGGTLVLNAVSKSPVGLADMPLTQRAMTVQGQLYSGQGVWLGGASTNLWSDWRNWTLAGGRPGLDGVESLSAGDTAVIAGQSEPIRVELPGGRLDLARLTLAG
jgi:hypothetical protein